MSCQKDDQQFKELSCSNYCAPLDSSHTPDIHENQRKHNTNEKKAKTKRLNWGLSFVLVFAVLVVVTAGCKNAASTATAQPPTQETVAPIEHEELSVSIEEQVLLDQQGIKITALSLYKISERPMLSILIENYGKNEIALELWYGQINDKSLDLINNNLNCIVAAGTKVSAEIELYNPYYVITIRDCEVFPEVARYM